MVTSAFAEYFFGMNADTPAIKATTASVIQDIVFNDLICQEYFY